MISTCKTLSFSKVGKEPTLSCIRYLAATLNEAPPPGDCEQLTMERLKASFLSFEWLPTNYMYRSTLFLRKVDVQLRYLEPVELC